MKITNVSTAVIAGNFPWVLVRITTDTGSPGSAKPIGARAWPNWCIGPSRC